MSFNKIRSSRAFSFAQGICLALALVRCAPVTPSVSKVRGLGGGDAASIAQYTIQVIDRDELENSLRDRPPSSQVLDLDPQNLEDFKNDGHMRVELGDSANRSGHIYLVVDSVERVGQLSARVQSAGSTAIQVEVSDQTDPSSLQAVRENLVGATLLLE